MSNEIVKYSNQFNAQALRKFTALDLDSLMAIAARVRDQEIDEVTFTFEELRRLAHVKKNLTDKELAARIVEVNDRLLACRFKFQDDSRTVQFTLFSGFETDWKTRKLLNVVNPRFSFLLNDLTSQFTRFELAEFTALKSSYVKETYRRLKQYRQTGVWKVSLEEFRRLLDVPKSYRTCDLNERVLKPIQAELGELLGLRIHKKYAKRGGRGRSSLVSLEFEFDPERVPGGKGNSARGPEPVRAGGYGQKIAGVRLAAPGGGQGLGRGLVDRGLRRGGRERAPGRLPAGRTVHGLPDGRAQRGRPWKRVQQPCGCATVRHPNPILA